MRPEHPTLEDMKDKMLICCCPFVRAELTPNPSIDVTPQFSSQATAPHGNGIGHEQSSLTLVIVLD